MTLEDYTAGALAAEMPASFPEEALKAQAVAARTFAVYKQSLGTDTQHPNAAVCADYTHCAAFVDLDTEAKQQWGSNAAAWTEKIKTAVRETNGQVVTYNGTPIAARVPLGSRQADRSRGQRLGNGYSVSHNRGQRRRRRLSQV